MTKDMYFMEVITMPLGVLETNCYLCYNGEKNAVIIDPGAKADDIISQISKNELQPVCVILTHGHFDHVTAVKEIKEKYPDIKIYLHEKDYGFYLKGRKLASQFLGMNYNDLTMPEEVDFILDGDIIEAGDIHFRVAHTPGHTQGCISLVNEKDRVIFSGDTLFKMSIGRTDLEGGNTNQLFQSIKSKLFTLNDDFTVYPGHGESTTIGSEKKSNPHFRGSY
jgi:glyoxylase-like metal-dependent hydrolase (beta-lactamase superfamily II)